MGLTDRMSGLKKPFGSVRGSPGCLRPLHLLAVHSQELVQLGEELRGWGAIVLLSQDKPDPLSWRNCGENKGKLGTSKSILPDFI